jgi:hypothetical protein
MFYCRPCGYQHNWPTDIFTPQSRGFCEECGELAECFDVPSSRLSWPEDPWAEIIPGETEAIESIKRTMSEQSDKCPGCGTRGTVPHEVNDMACRVMQFERAWKNSEDL